MRVSFAFRFRGLRVFRLLGLAGLLVFSASGCDRPTEPIIRDHGRIEWSVGGCYRIITATKTYQPRSLAAEFQQDGLTIEFEAVSRPTFNTCQAGEVVELLSVRRLP